MLPSRSMAWEGQRPGDSRASRSADHPAKRLPRCFLREPVRRCGKAPASHPWASSGKEAGMPCSSSWCPGPRIIYFIDITGGFVTARENGLKGRPEGGQGQVMGGARAFPEETGLNAPGTHRAVPLASPLVGKRVWAVARRRGGYALPEGYRAFMVTLSFPAPPLAEGKGGCRPWPAVEETTPWPHDGHRELTVPCPFPHFLRRGLSRVWAVSGRRHGEALAGVLCRSPVEPGSPGTFSAHRATLERERGLEAASLEEVRIPEDLQGGAVSAD